MLSYKRLHLGAVDLSQLGLPPIPNPYALPGIDSGELVFIESGLIQHLLNKKINVVERVLDPLRSRFRKVVVLDDSDSFQLDIDDDVISAVDIVLKVNGVYCDRALYNYVVGSSTANGRWTEKVEQKTSLYADDNLSKVRLFVPSFIGMSPEFRALTRPIYEASTLRQGAGRLVDTLVRNLPRPLNAMRPPKNTAHFIGSLTHVQRVTAVRMLKQSSLRWKGGITGVAQYVGGLNGAGLKSLEPIERNALEGRLAGEGLMARPLDRFRYLASMSDCKSVVSIVGHGEMCFRMAEAWSNRRILVCQDISHVRTLFPFKPGCNVIYCRPDLSDLVDVLDDVECNFSNYIDIAEQGRRDWIEWCSRVTEVLDYSLAPLRGAQTSGELLENNDRPFDHTRQLCH
jgi:hypothetical protein